MANQITPPRRAEDFFDSRGEPTLRFTRFLEELASQSNVTVSATNNANQATNSAISQHLQRQMDGLPKFTMDSTGFTMDSTQWSMDKENA